jgi:hypothetical protein
MTERRLALGGGYQDNDLVFATPDSTLLDHESVAKVFYRRWPAPDSPDPV